MNQLQNPKPRILQIDALRGLAVILVLGRHILFIPSSLPWYIQRPLSLWQQMGWIGVDLFFVLSGFLVSGLLFQEYRQNRRVLIGRFLLRRAFKIYPPFYLMLSVTLLGASLNQYPIDGWRYICEALFIQNYFEGLWNHTWSLAVEEHFYLLLSAVVFLLVRKANRSEDPFSFLPIFILVIGVQILVMRISFGAYYPVGDWEPILPFTHFRIDSLFFGVLLSYYFHFHHDRLEKMVRAFHGSISSLVIVAVFISLYFKLDASRIPYTIGFTVLYLGFGGLLLLTLFRAKNQNGRLLKIAENALAPIGKASYSIYLWHMMVYTASFDFFGGAEITNGLFLLHLFTYLMGSLALGMFLFRTIEVPFLALRHRVVP